MFQLLENNKIKLTRGDTAYIEVELDSCYQIQEGDTYTFSCKKRVSDSEYAFKITWPAGEILQISPSDTKNLEFGKYLYDIQLDTVDGEVFTLIGPAEIRIMEEITND